MIKCFSKLIYDKLSKSGVISEEDQYERECIQYGLEITLSSLLGYILVFIISFIMNCIPEGMIFLLVFVFLRQFSGGYHADTYLRCNLTFSLSYLAVILLSQYTAKILISHKELCILIFGLELILLSITAPVENRNKPIESVRRFYLYKLISCLLFLSFAVCGSLTAKAYPRISALIFYTLTLVCVLSVWGMIKERRYRNGKQKE